MISLFYEIALILASCLAFPKMLYRLVVQKKYRKSLLKRFGRGFPEIAKQGRPLIWIHSVSVGETKAVSQLIKILKNETNNPLLVVSSTTETGHAEALRSLPMADHHVYLPFDFRWIIYPIIKKTAPDLVILCESDFWFNFLNAAKQAGASIALVNGKLSERSVSRFTRVPFFSRPLFSLIDLFCLQNELYKKRFETLGVPVKKLHVTGNMKLDDPHTVLTSEQMKMWRNQLGIRCEDQVLVLGSTHDPEETLLVDVLNDLWKRFPRLKVILVPRHPERFNEVESILKQQNLPFQRFSKGNGTLQSAKIILMDAMGLLRQCYQLADVALVGGSFTQRVGGHNILEPCWYGIPVVYGPHMHSQPELVALARHYGCGWQVEANQLGIVLQSLLESPEEREKLGKAGRKLVSDARGATAKAIELMRPLMREKNLSCVK